MLQRVNQSFKYKTEIIEKTLAQPVADNYDNTENVPSIKAKVIIPLKYLSNFWRSLD